MTKEELEDGSVLYRFEVGEKARVKRSRYFHSHKTPMWANQYLCTIKRNNRTSVSVVIDGFENETHYVDPLDLIPVEKKKLRWNIRRCEYAKTDC